MSIGIVSAAYIAAAILFILSLGGLSGQESAKRAVWYGIVGMALAAFATVFGPGMGNYLVVLVMIAVGAYAGQYLAAKVEMTEMPQLVAALHSFVGLAAVFIGFNADIEMSRVADLKSGLSPSLNAAGIMAALHDMGLAGFAEKVAQVGRQLGELYGPQSTR